MLASASRRCWAAARAQRSVAVRGFASTASRQPPTARHAAAAASAGVAAGLFFGLGGWASVAYAAPGMTHNVPLADRHRVVLTQWPALEDPENGITTIESVFEWAKAHGYDALEFSVDDFKKKFMPTSPTSEVVSAIRACVSRYNIPTIGALYHVPDGITSEMGKRVHDDGTRFDLCLSDDSDFYPALVSSVKATLTTLCFESVQPFLAIFWVKTTKFEDRNPRFGTT